jgi:ADP-ribosylglycohydrolase
MPLTLLEKFYGCIVGDYVGSAMGAAVENWSFERIRAEYGTLDRLVSYMQYDNGWMREPGTTEDGVERQKLMVSAIMAKQDRVSCNDVVRRWITDIRPGAAGGVSEPFEGVLLEIARSGIPGKDIGRYCDYAGLVTMARSCQPIALINAGDIAGALDDIAEVGQLYQTSEGRGIRWAAAVVTAIAAATRLDATWQGVLEAVHRHGDPEVVAEIDRGMERTEACRDTQSLRDAIESIYHGVGNPYLSSYANEIVTKAFCINRMVSADPRQAILLSVNLGRDTDCTAAVAGAIAGALSGPGSIPEEWIRQVDHATSVHPLTNAKRSLREEADGLYQAYTARIRRARAYCRAMGPSAARPDLRERFMAAMAASRIAGAMAAPANELPWIEVQRRHGVLEGFLPRQRPDWDGDLYPGTTEENGERQKLMVRAIVRKGGAIIARDIRRAWLEFLDEQAARRLLFDYDVDLYRLAAAGVPADEIGAFCGYSRVAGFAASCLPIGLINAGDPLAAVEDATKCGRIFQKTDSGGIKWAAAVATGCAAACTAGADVDAVLARILAYARGTSDGWFDLTKQIERALAAARQCRSFAELRAAFDPLYSRVGLPFAMSFCNEVVPKALAVLALTGGAVKETLIAAVNIGRDAASVGAIACGIAGALNGLEGLPTALVDQLDEATRRNPWTRLKAPVAEEADDLYGAFRSKVSAMESLAAGAEAQGVSE